MTKRLILAASVVGLLGASTLASAHDDSSSDPRRCDTWYRPGHTSGTDSHHHTHSTDSSLPGGVGTVHNHTGHYVVRTDVGYVEVVGGSSYRGPDPSGNDYPGQGGYVQGEVDPGSGAPDVDFFTAAFGPNADERLEDDFITWISASHLRGCSNVAGQQGLYEGGPATGLIVSRENTYYPGDNELDQPMQLVKGMDLQFANSDTVNHTITSDKCAGASGNYPLPTPCPIGKTRLFDTGTITPNAYKAVRGIKALAVNSYSFRCAVHPGTMVGTLAIEADPT